MNLQPRLEKLALALAGNRTGSHVGPDALQDAIDRCLDEGRGGDFHENLFTVSYELTRASDTGREITIDEAFERAGVCGTMRTEVEAFVNMTPEEQCAYLDDVHAYLDARGDRATGKTPSPAGAELLAQEGQCATPEELAKWIDAL